MGDTKYNYLIFPISILSALTYFHTMSNCIGVSSEVKSVREVADRVDSTVNRMENRLNDLDSRLFQMERDMKYLPRASEQQRP